jgi:ABC-2 type transport system ATP-binding protein
MSLRIVGLTQRFGRHVALRDVSLHVRRGDCYGMIGHNGAGKTTALRAALGLLIPQQGRILVDGFDAAAHPREARARMGGLVERPGFHGHWSGERNLFALGQLAGMPRREARREARELFHRVGLAHAGERRVRGYSQGMRQRLGVAQALLGDPPYVLLDEPTNGLDPEGVAEMRVLLRRLTRDEGVTVVLSSHQLHELADLCTRVGVVREGRLVVEDELSALLAGHERHYVLETAGDPGPVLRELGLEPEAVEGGVRLALGRHEPADVVRRLVEEGVDVAAFGPRPPTLEEVYLRYTHETPEAPAPAAPVTVGEPPERRAAPRPILRMLRYEFQRWHGHVAVPILLALPALLGVFAVLRRRADVRRDAEDVAAGTLASYSDVTAFEGVAAALKAALPLAPYVLLGIASQSIAGALAGGTLRNTVLRSFARWQVVVGKALALFLAALVLYGMLAVAAVAASAWAFDFADMSEVLPNGKRFPLVSAAELWPELRHALVSPILPLLAYAAVGLWAGCGVRRGAAGLSLALGLGVLVDLLRAVARSYDLEGWLPSAYLPSPLGDTSFVNYFHFAAQGVSNVAFDHGGGEVLVPLAWTVAAVVCAVLIFRRRLVP